MSKESLEKVIGDVLDERFRQDRKWGMPQPAMKTPGRALAVLGEEFGEACKAAVEMDAAETPDGALVWRDSLRTELVQVAAVAVSIIEHLDTDEIDCTPRQ